MTRNELLTLKQNLEQKRNVKKYVILEDVQEKVFGDEKPYKESKPMIIDEIMSNVDTKFVVYQIENYLQKLVKLLVDIGVSFDEISFLSFSGIICEEKSVDGLYDEEGIHVVGISPENVVSNIVPVRFKLHLESLKMDFIVRERIQKKFPDIVGLVELDKFVDSMDVLGYQLGGHENIDFSTYLKSFLAEDGNVLNITVDLGRQEKTKNKECVKQ